MTKITVCTICSGTLCTFDFEDSNIKLVKEIVNLTIFYQIDDIKKKLIIVLYTERKPSRLLVKENGISVSLESNLKYWKQKFYIHRLKRVHSDQTSR